MIKPAPASQELSAAAAQAASSRGIAARYRRAQVLGLLLIAGEILAVVLLRADRHVLFPPGWWR